jgi:hypothetical protein
MRPVTVDPVERALAAFNAGDAAAFAGLFTDDGVIIDYPDTMAGTGPAEIQAYVSKAFAAFPKARVALQGRFDLGARQITLERFDRGDGTSEYDAALVYTITDAGIARMDFVRALPAAGT